MVVIKKSSSLKNDLKKRKRKTMKRLSERKSKAVTKKKNISGGMFGFGVSSNDSRLKYPYTWDKNTKSAEIGTRFGEITEGRMIDFGYNHVGNPYIKEGFEQCCRELKLMDLLGNPKTFKYEFIKPLFICLRRVIPPPPMSTLTAKLNKVNTVDDLRKSLSPELILREKLDKLIDAYRILIYALPLVAHELVAFNNKKSDLLTEIHEVTNDEKTKFSNILALLLYFDMIINFKEDSRKSNFFKELPIQLKGLELDLLTDEIENQQLSFEDFVSFIVNNLVGMNNQLEISSFFLLEEPNQHNDGSYNEALETLKNKNFKIDSNPEGSFILKFKYGKQPEKAEDEKQPDRAKEETVDSKNIDLYFQFDDKTLLEKDTCPSKLLKKCKERPINLEQCESSKFTISQITGNSKMYFNYRFYKPPKTEVPEIDTQLSRFITLNSKTDFASQNISSLTFSKKSLFLEHVKRLQKKFIFKDKISINWEQLLLDLKLNYPKTDTNNPIIVSCDVFIKSDIKTKPENVYLGDIIQAKNSADFTLVKKSNFEKGVKGLFDTRIEELKQNTYQGFLNKKIKKKLLEEFDDLYDEINRRVGTSNHEKVTLDLGSKYDNLLEIIDSLTGDEVENFFKDQKTGKIDITDIQTRISNLPLNNPDTKYLLELVEKNSLLDKSQLESLIFELNQIKKYRERILASQDSEVISGQRAGLDKLENVITDLKLKKGTSGDKYKLNDEDPVLKMVREITQDVSLEAFVSNKNNEQLDPMIGNLQKSLKQLTGSGESVPPAVADTRVAAASTSTEGVASTEGVESTEGVASTEAQGGNLKKIRKNIKKMKGGNVGQSLTEIIELIKARNRDIEAGNTDPILAFIDNEENIATKLEKCLNDFTQQVQFLGDYLKMASNTALNIPDIVQIIQFFKNPSNKTKPCNQESIDYLNEFLSITSLEKLLEHFNSEPRLVGELKLLLSEEIFDEIIIGVRNNLLKFLIKEFVLNYREEYEQSTNRDKYYPELEKRIDTQLLQMKIKILELLLSFCKLKKDEDELLLKFLDEGSTFNEFEKNKLASLGLPDAFNKVGNLTVIREKINSQNKEAFRNVFDTALNRIFEQKQSGDELNDVLTLHSSLGKNEMLEEYKGKLLILPAAAELDKHLDFVKSLFHDKQDPFDIPELLIIDNAEQHKFSISKQQVNVIKEGLPRVENLENLKLIDSHKIDSSLNFDFDMNSYKDKCPNSFLVPLKKEKDAEIEWMHKPNPLVMKAASILQMALNKP